MKIFARILCLAAFPLMLVAQDAPNPAEAVANPAEATAKADKAAPSKGELKAVLDNYVKEVIKSIEAVQVAADKLNLEAEKLAEVADAAKKEQRKVAEKSGEMAPISNMISKVGSFTDSAKKLSDSAGDAKVAAEAVLRNESLVSKYYSTFWAIIPPIVAIILALITKEVYSSLFVGIVIGGLFTANYNVTGTIDTIVNDGLIAAVSGNAGIFIFLVILGVLVALINKTGATVTFGKWAQEHIKSRVGAQFATFILGVLIFIDDYFNCLTVGSVMLPVTDSKKVSRAKLAYLIDATAAPICMIAPVSSWAAAVSGYAEGTQYSGLQLFCRAIPYNFYSLLTFVFILGLIFLKFDFGPMATHEKNAMEKGDLFTSGGEVDNGIRPLENPKGRFADMLIPVIVLIASCVFALLYVGGYDGKETGFIKAFGDTDATVGLPWGGIVTLVFTIIYLLARRVVAFKDAMKSIAEGFVAMVPAILILTLATALKNMTTALDAKGYIAFLMEGSAASLANLLPAVIFLVACCLAFATGTSWGTFGILIPIVVAIFPAESDLLFIGMSACLAGAVCGDHCSPISDTTIMSSAGARCEHINHVTTQLPYAIFVALVSFVGFIIAGLTRNWFVSFSASLIVMILALIFVKKVLRKQGA
ncbi:MAG: Na+/H+ antiporter NhaC family protein [Victivallales bacterium]|nr:Na+/H+ antiporter NhaC family protein [Victivallales bacterium]